jgi:hypothetical protein
VLASLRLTSTRFEPQELGRFQKRLSVSAFVARPVSERLRGRAENENEKLSAYDL